MQRMKHQVHSGIAVPSIGQRVSRWAMGLCVALLVGLGMPGLALAQTVYYHNDTAGSPIVATDEAGNLLWRESYRPYGERMLKPAAANNQWFHGKQADPDTGMSDFGARNYDPVLGRFLSIDPVDFTEKNIHSFNRYNYGNNNPLKYKDPDGRQSIGINGFPNIEAEINSYKSAMISVYKEAALFVGGSAVIRGGAALYRSFRATQAAPKTLEALSDMTLAERGSGGAASEMSVGEHVVRGVSGETSVDSPRVLANLMGNRSKASRAPWHGGCSEVVCANKLLGQGVDPAGGTVRTVNIGGEFHNQPKMPCPSCQDLLKNLGVTW